MNGVLTASLGVPPAMPAHLSRARASPAALQCPKASVKGPAMRPSALACLVAWVLLVDDVDTPLAAHHAILAVPRHQRLERVLDLHRSSSRCSARFRGILQNKWAPKAP